jgi:hypothetical protein
MAQLIPALEQIRQFKVEPEDGELHLLEFLDQVLGDDYEVYFQPFLNGDRPDIVIMRKGAGVLLIEVKDWDLSHYSADSNGDWYVHAEGKHKKKSPIEQVTAYKANLFNLHIEGLLERKLENNKLWATIQCAVYFHRADQSRVTELCGQQDHVELLTSGSLTKDKFQGVLDRTWLSKSSYFFDEPLYNRFHRFLQPPEHTRNQGKEPIYTAKQKGLSVSRSVQQKVRGVAGSGKTRVLARRAVNAHLRTGGQVLILTFNITLRNYIHDAISEVRESFPWRFFYITHYHQFFNTEANNYDLPTLGLDAYDDIGFFESVKSDIRKYDAIFIDEIQDYESEWIRIIKKYFLVEDGEFVVFGDEKQNIYRRSLGEDKRPNTTIPGAWNELNDSFRSASPIINLAFEYQDHFFRDRYDLDEIEIPAQADLFSEQQRLQYMYIAADVTMDDVFSRIHGVLTEWHIHPNDVCVLSVKREPLRTLDYQFRTLAHENTSTSFESREQWENIREIENGKKELDTLRKNKKLHFWMNPGTVKLSTIASFKGWEINTLVVLIEKNDDIGKSSDDELVYTAITRCRNNLFVINMANSQYHDFFQQNMPTA